MDTLEEVAEETLIYFEGVLKSNIKISLARISQIAGMVIYIVDSINIRSKAIHNLFVSLSCPKCTHFIVG